VKNLSVCTASNTAAFKCNNQEEALAPNLHPRQKSDLKTLCLDLGGRWGNQTFYVSEEKVMWVCEPEQSTLLGDIVLFIYNNRKQIKKKQLQTTEGPRCMTKWLLDHDMKLLGISVLS